MSIQQLRLSVRSSDADPTIRYYNQVFSFPRPVPLAQVPVKEVEVNHRIRKLLKKAVPIAIVASASFLIIGKLTLAATPTAGIPDAVLPSDIQKVGSYLMKIMSITGTILAIILVQFAGGYKMLRKSREASEWLTDILKGYATVIAAPILIMSIAFLSWILFKGIPWFISPF